MNDISIIIPSYNTVELTLRCLRSVNDACLGIDFEIWVIDNNSDDGSVEQVKNNFPSVCIIQNRTNVGYAKANNQAMEFATGKIWVLLNSDTVVTKDTFTNIGKAFDDYPNAGVVGPMLLNLDGSTQPSFGKFVSPWTELLFQSFLFKVIPVPFPVGRRINPFLTREYTSIHQVEWVTGACLAIRQDVAKRVGFLDETLFMYGEDLEWCWRVNQAGYNVLYYPAAKVTHHASHSAKRNFDRWIYNYTYGQLKFAAEHLPTISFRLIGLFIGFGSLLRIFIWKILKTLNHNPFECQSRVLGYQKSFRLGMTSFFSGKL